MKKEILKYKSSVETLNVVGGKVNSVRFTEETTNTVRVYDDGKIGVAGALGEADVSALENAAVEKLSEQGIPYAYVPGKTVKKEIVRRKAFDQAKLLKAGRSLTAKVAKACPGFLVSGKVECGEYSGAYKNSEGSDLSFESSLVSVGFQLKDKNSSNIMDAFYSASFPLYGKTASDVVVSDMKMLHDAFFTEKKQIGNGKYKVIVDKFDLLGLLASHFVAESYVAGSILSGKIGEKVFSEDLSVYVDRNPSTNPGTAFFDAEGVVLKDYRAALVENGVVKNVLANKNSAVVFNLPQSGTAIASYDGVPSAGIPGLFVKPSAKSLAELTADEPAVYIAITSGGDMTNDGTIGMPVMLAFMVEKGKITGRVCEFNASGNIFDVLGKDFVGVSSDNLFKADKEGMIVTTMNLMVG